MKGLNYQVDGVDLYETFCSIISGHLAFRSDFVKIYSLGRIPVERRTDVAGFVVFAVDSIIILD